MNEDNLIEQETLMPSRWKMASKANFIKRSDGCLSEKMIIGKKNPPPVESDKF